MTRKKKKKTQLEQLLLLFIIVFIIIIIIIFNQYPSMQENLITTIDRINNKIFAINSKTGVVTPNLAAHIIYQRQSALRVRYRKFMDGVHVNHKVK